MQSREVKYSSINIDKSSSSNKSSILIIYTGGTFGMVYEDDYLVPFDFQQVIERIPVIKNLGVDLKVCSFKDPVDSSNMGILEWQTIASLIFENYTTYDGFVVLHGTDTMAYSASAVSFMLEGLNKPVIFTGAQIPIGATRSDARENLITAIEIASTRKNEEARVREVCIYFDYKLLKANRSQKVSSSDFDAFSSGNYPVLAEAGVEIVFNDAYLSDAIDHQEIQFIPEMDNSVSILKIFPGISDGVLRSILSVEGLKGVVMETFGSGNVMCNGTLISILKESIAQGLVVLNVSQCSGGRVVHGLYETSKALEGIGVISGHDMTTEAAVAKLMHLLGNYTDIAQVGQLLDKPLRGELTPRLY